MGGTRCEVYLTTDGAFYFLQDVSPLEHESITRSTQEEGPFESPETQDVMEVLVLQTQLQTDALSEVYHSPWCLLRLGCPSRLVNLNRLVGTQEKIPLVPFLHTQY